MRMRMNITLVAVLSAGCLFDGEGTRGLPCNVDSECGPGQSCIERICGGPSNLLMETDTDGDTDDAQTGDETGEVGGSEAGVEEPDLCTVNQCRDGNTLEICLDDGKVATQGCQGVCGPNAGSLGCHHSPDQREDVCYCEAERAACSTEGARDCAGQGALSVCMDGTWHPYDCDTICVDAGYGGASGCGPGDQGADVCFCDSTCTEGEARCSGTNTISYCLGGSWQKFTCDELCVDSGFSGGLACTYFPDSGGDGCACL